MFVDDCQEMVEEGVEPDSDNVVFDPEQIAGNDADIVPAFTTLTITF